MSALLLALGLLLPSAAAWALLRRVHPSLRGVPGEALRAGLALVVGPGAATLLAYAWLVAGGSLGTGYALVEAACCVAVVAWAARGWAPADAPPSPRPGTLDRLALAFAAVAFGLGAVVFLRGAVASPFGDWDAWAIWTQHARFLHRGAAQGWRHLFDPALGWSHNEYPLLVPTAIARLWAYAGEGTGAPALVAGVHCLAPLLIVFGAVARAAGLLPAAAALGLVSANVGWFLWAYSLGADVPAAALLCAAAGALVEADATDGRARRGLEILAGVALGLSGWTKDEGLMFVAVFVPFALLRAGRAGALPRALALVAGLAVPLAVRAHFQVALAPALAGALTTGQTASGVLARLVDPGRWGKILGAVPGHLPGRADWLHVFPFVLAVLAGARPRTLLRSYAVPALGAYAAFLLVYAATPLPLDYHITTSAPRILQQPFPALVLGLFAAAGMPAAGVVSAEAPPAAPGGRGRRERRRADRAGAAS